MAATEGSTVTFHRRNVGVRKRYIQHFAKILQVEVTKGRPFHCRIAGDLEVRCLNRDYRGRDYPTDVLSFPVVKSAFHDARHTLGDVVIAFGQARAQARHYRHPIEDEILLLMLHGVLHLMGMDHETDSGQMERAERRWRQRLGLPTGVIQRVPE